MIGCPCVPTKFTLYVNNPDSVYDCDIFTNYGDGWRGVGIAYHLSLTRIGKIEQNDRIYLRADMPCGPNPSWRTESVIDHRTTDEYIWDLTGADWSEINGPNGNQTIFPNLTGQELIDSLIANYKTNTVLSYDNARDILFANIYQHNDSLTCVYTGYTIYLDPSQDPSTHAYNNGISTEHTWPQSKGAVGQAKSDMHHLYPVRSAVNSSRGNDPFAESPDADTDKWWRLDYYLTTIPTEFIDEYSEKDNDADIFEPREDHKGNVARAMFYFYTMYKHEADSCDPEYFQIQKDVLYQWHIDDTVDSSESVRNDKIASYQGDKKNPFVLDSSLVSRAYFHNQ